MTFNIDGTVIRCAGRTEGTIRQIGFYQARDHDAWFADITVQCHGKPRVRGKLRFTSEAHERFPGSDSLEKARAVGVKLAEWAADNVPNDAFLLRIDADDFGVQIVSV